MTENKRIILNVIVTYGRSVYGIVLGLFTARWILAALGTVDFGLYGLIGGLVVFIAFLNTLLSVATARFFAYSVGRCQVRSEDGLKDCRDLFSAACAIHFTMAVVLTCIGYPLGTWAVQHYLRIPPDRVCACLWVWRMVCLNCFFSMVNVPFAAMYKAKQEIAEMTLYSFFTVTANAIFLYYAA